MVHVERHRFSVPEKRGSDKLISLEGQVYEPEHPEGTVVFAPGIAAGGGRIYEGFLCILAQQGFRVATVNYRGFGTSEGVFTTRSSIDDLINVKRQVKASHIVGHSLGAGFALMAVNEFPEEFSSVYVMSPYLGPGSLPIIGPWPKPTPVRAGLLAMHALSQTPFVSIADRSFANWAYQFFIGGQPPKAGTIRTLKELAYVKVDAISEEVPIAVMLATNDWELGTVRNERRYIRLRGQLLGLNHGIEDYSQMAIGLNHRLNKMEGKLFAQDCGIQLAQSIGQFAAKYTG